LEDETTSKAVLPPAAAGVKTICTEQLAPLASVAQVVAPQALGPHEKTPPEVVLIWKPTLFSAAPPVLLTVTVCGVLACPTGCAVKLKLSGLTPRAGANIPVPLKATVFGESAALDEMFSVAVSEPTTEGSNCTLIVQGEPGARFAVQGLVTWKSAA
jgi:hypothetical protein